MRAAAPRSGSGSASDPAGAMTPLAENAKMAVPGQSTGRAGAEPARILVVDDDRNNLIAMHGLLEDLADEVVFVRSGEEALRLILRMEFAVIMMASGRAWWRERAGQSGES